ncbi:hypothetical protein [Blastopirellula retiformator]|uniref:hypothetical protein n=1 Tax=Blastopirellula retiformator TaxID=2527970 RepID=UPI0011B7CAA1|nr:hypothetical protein [Blastopirellula retiformator]
MQVTILVRTYDSYGYSKLFSPIAALLSLRLGDYGPAIDELDLLTWLPSRTRMFRPTLERSFDEFHKEIKTLPRMTFRRKSNRFELSFPSSRFFAGDQRQDPAAQMLNDAAAEVAQFLPLIKKRLKKTDDFDVVRFLEDANRLLCEGLGSVDEWRQIEQESNEKRRAELAKMSPWELLDIDWDDYHPSAREILDDPFYWSCTDDTAPHGNDTGADLLHSFLKWNKRNRTTDPLRFLDRLLDEWGFQPIDWTVTDPAMVNAMGSSDPIGLDVANESIIALAFAVVKLRGKCPPEIVELALAGVNRTAFLVEQSDCKAKIKELWYASIAKIRTKLNELRR